MSESMFRPMFISLVLLAGLLPGTGHAQDDSRSVKTITLAETVERALRHNLDLRYERINPTIAEWGVIREQGIYDPAITGSISYGERTDLLSPERAAALGLGALEAEALSADLGVGGFLPTGARYDLTTFQDRSSGTLNAEHVYTGGWLLSARQPLLRNAGFGIASANIRIARRSQAIAREQFARQAMDVVSAAQDAYYELVFAIANHEARLEDLRQARTLLDENRKRMQIGVLSPLDVTQAEAGAAERQEAVVIAARAIEDAANRLKRLISGDVGEFVGVRLVPADPAAFQMVELDVTRSIRTALVQRPEYAAAREAVERQQITLQFRRNQLWPQLDLFGTLGYNARSPMFTSTNAVGASSFGDYLGNLAESEARVWSVGLAVTIPIGDRQARASYRIARLQREQAVIDLKRVEQDILIEVDNAVGRVRTNLERIEATRVATRLAQESLEAELQRLRAGTSTSLQVLQAQAQLAAARSAAIRARADYDQSLVALARAEGTTLQRQKIQLEDEPKVDR